MGFQPGNTFSKGRPPNEKAFAAMLRIALAEAHGENGGNKLRAVADAVVKEAMSGNVAAFNAIADRVDGKVPQGIMGEDGGPPITIAGEITLSATRAIVAEIAGSNSGSAPSEPGQD